MKGEQRIWKTGLKASRCRKDREGYCLAKYEIVTFEMIEKHVLIVFEVIYDEEEN